MTLFGSETDCQLEINYLFQKNINPNSYHIKKNTFVNNYLFFANYTRLNNL